MTMTDPIADMLTRIRNANTAHHESVTMPSSTVKSRIARPEAQFFPEVDLYQNGRKVKDRTVTPANQPAHVPETNLGKIRGVDRRESDRG